MSETFTLGADFIVQETPYQHIIVWGGGRFRLAIEPAQLDALRRQLVRGEVSPPTPEEIAAADRLLAKTEQPPAPATRPVVPRNRRVTPAPTGRLRGS